MKSSSFGYLLKQGTTNLWSNRMMTLASIGVLTACLLIVGFAVLLTENINNMVGYIESQNEMVAFMYKPDEMEALDSQEEQTDGAEEGEGLESVALTQEAVDAEEQAIIDDIYIEIDSIANVSEIRFVSNDEGLESQKEQLGELGSLLEDYEGERNPIRHSFVIKVHDLSMLEQTADEIREIEWIYQVNAAGDVASTITGIRDIVNIIGWSIVAALVIVSLVIIFNTIRATIFSRRREINIMKYVGATNFFIRMPFVVEGICLGIISAFFAYGIIWLGYSYIVEGFSVYASEWIQSAAENIMPFEAIAVDLAIFFASASVLIGVIGSALSIRNHLKV